MTAPPGICRTTEPPVEHISGERETDLSTKSGQERYLVGELGCTYPQAKALIRAYQRDLERPTVTAARTYRPSFIDWIMRQAPNGVTRPRAVRKHEWRCSA